MSAYLRTRGGERILLDTAKCKLVFEETEYDLTGATLDMYEADWVVAPGELTSGGTTEPCRTLIVRDRFTGFGVEVPYTLEKSAEVAHAFVNHQGWLRNLLRRGRGL